MRPYGFTLKQYGNDSLKAGDVGVIRHPSVGTKNMLRVYKKAARQAAVVEIKKALAN